MIKKIQSDIYGTYYVEYCIRFNNAILVEVGVDMFMKAQDAFYKASIGRWTYSLVPEKSYENHIFDFLLGYPFKDINLDYSYPEKKWKKLPLAINRDKIDKLLIKYPQFKYVE